MGSTAYQIFISFKNTDKKGNVTEDAQLARDLYVELTGIGYNVFLSSRSLEDLGVSDYKGEIDRALDEAQTLVLIGTNPDYIRSKWVRYEWDSFYNEILSGLKPKGRLFAYLKNCSIQELPRPIRQSQVFFDGENKFSDLIRFISNAPGKGQPVDMGENATRNADAKKPAGKKSLKVGGIVLIALLIIAGAFYQFQPDNSVEKVVQPTQTLKYLNLIPNAGSLHLSAADFGIIHKNDTLELISSVEEDMYHFSTADHSPNDTCRLVLLNENASFKKDGHESVKQLPIQPDTVQFDVYELKSEPAPKEKAERSVAKTKVEPKSSQFMVNLTCVVERGTTLRFQEKYSDYIQLHYQSDVLLVNGVIGGDSFSDSFRLNSNFDIVGPSTTGGIAGMQLFVINECEKITGHIDYMGKTGKLPANLNWKRSED